MRIHRGSGRGFGRWDIPGMILLLALAWIIAANHHFSEAWDIYAAIASVLVVVGFLRKLFRV
jgi:hypothetical protein